MQITIFMDIFGMYLRIHHKLIIAHYKQLLYKILHFIVVTAAK